MIDTIPTYSDPIRESVLQMGVSGQAPVLVSNAASVRIQLRNNFDKQRSHGKNLGRVKFTGLELAKASIDFVIMPDEERDFWNKVVPIFRQKGPRGNGPPIDVINLQLNRAGITTVTVLSADIDEPSPRDGRSVKLQLQEWAPGPSDPKPDASPKGIPRFEPDPSLTLEGQPGGIVPILVKHS